MHLSLFLVLTFYASLLTAQTEFYRGADLSYVNEMEDCGVRYRNNGTEQDPYAIFAGAGANLIRLRLWHSPAWYDDLNDGNRYGDLADVKRSIVRAKEQGVDVLLDFHLSDTWADPSRQVAPAAWTGIVDDLPVLNDSLYNYIRYTLSALAADGLLPEMVQIGNETNKGILQSDAADAAGWALDWPRNAKLFKRAIKAVRDVERATGKDIDVALHIAGPNNAGWLLDGFQEHGVDDYDVIGLSYYWAWHQPLTITETGDIVARLKTDFPGKKVMILETGYIWTNENNDTANNIISSVQSGYAPASPDNQKRWLIDLTQEMISRGADGVIYWEPAWVSSACRTQWGQGAHQENAAFFDFGNNVLPGGGMDFYGHDYAGLVATAGSFPPGQPLRVLVRPDARLLTLVGPSGALSGIVKLRLIDVTGRTALVHNFTAAGPVREDMRLPVLPAGFYFLEVRSLSGWSANRRVFFLRQ